MTEGEFPKNRGTLLGSDLILGFGNAYKEIIKGAPLWFPYIIRVPYMEIIKGASPKQGSPCI